MSTVIELCQKLAIGEKKYLKLSDIAVMAIYVLLSIQSSSQSQKTSLHTSSAPHDRYETRMPVECC